MAASQLISAAGMFLNFLSVLQEELNKAGGSPWMLYFAQKEHARPMMALLAKTLVESKLWKVPKSLIIEEIHREQDRDWRPYDILHCWTLSSKTAHELTTLRFSNDPVEYTSDDIIYEMPDVGPYEKCGDVVRYKGQDYVVTHCEDTENGKGLFLAPAEYFNLEI